MEKCNYSEGAIHKMPEYTYSLKLYILAGHFVHDAVISYELICATCTLWASSHVQVAHMSSHLLNSYKNFIIF